MLKSPLKPFSGKKADMYAVGVVLFRLYFGSLPYKGYTTQVTSSLVLKGLLLFPHKTNPNLSDFLRKLLTVDPNKRLSIEEALTHPWITNNGENIVKIEQLHKALPIQSSITVEDEKNAVVSVQLSVFYINILIVLCSRLYKS